MFALYEKFKMMATKKKAEPKEKKSIKVEDAIVEPTETIDLPVESDEQPETKEVEQIVSRSLSGGEAKEKVKLVAKKVFEPMQGIHKIVWTKE